MEKAYKIALAKLQALKNVKNCTTSQKPLKIAWKKK